MPPKVDITGQRFGWLIAVKPTDRRAGTGSIIWECRCDCGKVVYEPANRLRYHASNITSCGCRKHKAYIERTKPNSHSKTGIRGVYYHKDGDGNINGYVTSFRGKHLGMFDNIGDATVCYLKAKEQYLKG